VLVAVPYKNDGHLKLLIVSSFNFVYHIF